MSDREIVFWDCDEHREELIHSDRDDAIEAEIDDCCPEHPETIAVYGFARVELDPLRPRDIWDWLTDGHIQEAIGPNERFTPTPAMQLAAEQFCDTFQREFVPWACEQVTEETVNVREWLREHRPDWLAEWPPAPEGGTET